MWPFRRKGWTEKQKKFRRDCRAEEKEMEQLINWMALNVEAVKRAKERQMTQVATHVPTDPDSLNVGPPDGLPDEFTGSGDPKGDACCYEPKCPCHGGDE